MNNKIVEFSSDTLCDLLATGKYHTVLLQFFHGLGDAVDFHANVLPILREQFPDVQFSVQTHLGQQELFGHVDPVEEHYDLAVRVRFLCSEWETECNETKAERCLRKEMGLFYLQPELYTFVNAPSPLIGVHFFSTSSESVCADETLAKFIWRKIAGCGLIPIDTHFVHPAANHEKRPYAWQTRNVADVEPTPHKLAGLLSRLGGFAGVSSGNFWMALCQLPPQRILYIETDFPVEKLTRLPVHHAKSVDDIGAIDAWLNDCMKEL